MAAVWAGLCSNNFNTALAQVSSVLAIKIGALNLLTVRSRLLTGDMATGKEGGVVSKGEQAMPTWLVAVFKATLIRC